MHPARRGGPRWRPPRAATVLCVALAVVLALSGRVAYAEEYMDVLLEGSGGQVRVIQRNTLGSYTQKEFTMRADSARAVKSQGGQTLWLTVASATESTVSYRTEMGVTGVLVSQWDARNLFQFAPDVGGNIWLILCDGDTAQLAIARTQAMLPYGTVDIMDLTPLLPGGSTSVCSDINYFAIDTATSTAYLGDHAGVTTFMASASIDDQSASPIGTSAVVNKFPAPTGSVGVSYTTTHAIGGASGALLALLAPNGDTGRWVATYSLDDGDRITGQPWSECTVVDEALDLFVSPTGPQLYVAIASQVQVYPYAMSGGACAGADGSATWPAPAVTPDPASSADVAVASSNIVGLAYGSTLCAQACVYGWCRPATGLCVCKPGFTGAVCDEPETPPTCDSALGCFHTDTDETRLYLLAAGPKSIDSQVSSSSNPTLSFSISYETLGELDAVGNPAAVLSLPDGSYSDALFRLTDALNRTVAIGLASQLNVTQLTGAAPAADGSATLVDWLQALFVRPAVISVRDGSLLAANDSSTALPVAPGTFKSSLRVRNWQWADGSHSFAVALLITSQQQLYSVPSLPEVLATMRPLVVEVPLVVGSGSTFMVRLARFAFVDNDTVDVATPVAIEQLSDYQVRIVLRIGFFGAAQLYYDPDFAVLLDGGGTSDGRTSSGGGTTDGGPSNNGGGNANGTNGALVAAIVSPIVGVAGVLLLCCFVVIVAAHIVYLVARHRRLRLQAHGKYVSAAKHRDRRAALDLENASDSSTGTSTSTTTTAAAANASSSPAITLTSTTSAGPSSASSSTGPGVVSAAAAAAALAAHQLPTAGGSSDDTGTPLSEMMSASTDLTGLEPRGR